MAKRSVTQKTKTVRVSKKSSSKKVNPLLGKLKSIGFVVIFALIGVTAALISFADTFDAKAFLTAKAPGILHEDIPHGVPSGYDWQSRATLHSTTPPSSDSGYMNLWGQIYVNQSNVRPVNTRVAVANCQLWGLPKTVNTWTKLVDDTPTSLEGGMWSEDFTRNGPALSIKTESDSSQSMVNVDGYNAHFWARRPLVRADSNYREFIVACSSRLVLANAASPDDRASSTYLISLGADWRKSDYGCPLLNGITVCNGIGISRFIKVTNDWRRVVYSSLSATDLSTLPLPPNEAFLNPNGTYGDSSTIAPAPAPTPTPTPDPTPTPEPTPTPTPPPLVTLRGLSEGQTISGGVSLEAIPTNITGITTTQFFIDNNLVTSETLAPWCLSGDTTSVCHVYDTKQLGNGNHVFKAVVNHSTGSTSAQVTVNVQNVSQPVLRPVSAGNGLVATYYNNKDLTGSTYRRTDKTVNFSWNSGSPNRKIGRDTFSARWVGKIVPRSSETYTFRTHSDDGVRLYVNNQLVIDNWSDHSPTSNSGSIQLEAGIKYNIKLEYYENTGDATMQLFWKTGLLAEQVVPQSQLFTN